MSGVGGLNVLFITLDQFRGDSLSCLDHPVVRTPNLDALARHGTHFTRHYTQSTPCAPGRAGLYTGMYQMNHRVVANGTPLDERFDNVARLARRAGYRPCLFGYTDQSIDPCVATGPDDPRLLSYEGLLPGMDWKLDLSGPHQPWVDHLDAMGHDVSQGHLSLLATENDRIGREYPSTDLLGNTGGRHRVLDALKSRRVGPAVGTLLWGLRIVEGVLGHAASRSSAESLLAGVAGFSQFPERRTRRGVVA